MKYPRLLGLALGGLVVMNASAEEDTFLWLEGVDDPKALEWVVAQNEATAV